MKVFLDTNIVLDYFSGRMGDTLAEQLVQIGLSDNYQMCISALTAANTMYIASRHYKSLLPMDIASLFSILPMDAAQWQNACQILTPDFEDALQMTCAYDAQCSFIITRNAEHFAESIIPVCTPAEFLAKVPR